MPRKVTAPCQVKNADNLPVKDFDYIV